MPDGVPDEPAATSGGALDGIVGMLRRSPVTTAIAALNVGVFLLLEAAGGSTDLRVLVRFGAQATPLLEDGELWRLFTSMFLHIGLVHLLANMWALVIFGPLFERSVGRVRYVALYLASGLAGSAVTALFVSPRSVSAGASGAIFGLLGAFAVLGFRLRDTELGSTWARHALVLIGLNVVLGLTVPSIGLEAHLGGLVAGACITAVETWGGIPARRQRTGPARFAGLTVAALTATASVASVVVLVA
ncbi:MAG: rhomboid family intramembrane serine protease [Actinobacteria bacterium]|nr:rhomboid family intramembrane serine protease [Actinomycetota bacterium]